MSEADDRQTAIDHFAATAAPPESRAVIPQQAFSVTGDRVVGAQPVAVHRDDARVLTRLKALAAAAGDDWYYRFPVRNKKENRTDYIEGGSIKLANDLARIYGNCEITTHVQDLGDSWLVYARFTDFESGFSMTRPFQQRKNAARLGGDDDARRLDIALQIGVSKSIRNVVLNALQTFADVAFNAAKDSLVEKIGKDLPGWRQRTTDRLQEHVNLIRVERVIGRKVEEWRAPDVAKAIALMKSVQDGMATLDETFPPLEDDRNLQVVGKPVEALDQFAEKKTRRAKKEEQDPQAPTPGVFQAAGKPVEPPQAATEIDSTQPQQATEIDSYKLAQQLIIACEKADTPEVFNAAVEEFRARIRDLPNKDDRLDINGIASSYGQWRNGNITPKEMEQQVKERLDLIRKRAKTNN